mgnify:CR=1 FL=1
MREVQARSRWVGDVVLLIFQHLSITDPRPLTTMMENPIQKRYLRLQPENPGKQPVLSLMLMHRDIIRQLNAPGDTIQQVHHRAIGI